MPLNGLEGMSPILFYTPAIYSGINGEVYLSLRRIDNAMSRGLATFDNLVTIRFTHDTAAELSQ